MALLIRIPEKLAAAYDFIGKWRTGDFSGCWLSYWKRSEKLDGIKGREGGRVALCVVFCAFLLRTDGKLTVPQPVRCGRLIRALTRISGRLAWLSRRDGSEPQIVCNN